MTTKMRILPANFEALEEAFVSVGAQTFTRPNNWEIIAAEGLICNCVTGLHNVRATCRNVEGVQVVGFHECKNFYVSKRTVRSSRLDHTLSPVALCCHGSFVLLPNSAHDLVTLPKSTGPSMSESEVSSILTEKISSLIFSE